MFNFKSFEDKDVLVPWSGGLDSTLLVLEFLNAGARVHPVTVSFKGQHPNEDHEEFARREMTKIINRLSFKSSFIPKSIVLPTIAGGIWPRAFRKSQHVIWESILPLYTPANGFVALGYTSEDSLSPYFDDIITNFFPADYLWRDDCIHEGDAQSLILPLRHMTKIQVRNRAEELAQELNVSHLLRFISTCFRSTKIGGQLFRCGECYKCKELVDAETTELYPVIYTGGTVAHTDTLYLNRKELGGKIISAPEGIFIELTCGENDGDSSMRALFTREITGVEPSSRVLIELDQTSLGDIECDTWVDRLCEHPISRVLYLGNKVAPDNDEQSKEED